MCQSCTWWEMSLTRAGNNMHVEVTRVDTAHFVLHYNAAKLFAYSRDCHIYRAVMRIMKTKTKGILKKNVTFTFVCIYYEMSEFPRWKKQAFIICQFSLARVQAKWRLMWNRFGLAGFLRDKTRDSLWSTCS